MKPSATLRNIALLVCAVAAFHSTASAQDSQQALRLWVQYNSVKNGAWATLDDAKKAEVSKLDAAALAANASHDYGEAMKDYFHAIAIMRSLGWTPSRALGFGLRVTADRSVVEPESTIEVRIGQIFKLDQAPPGPVSATIDLVAVTTGKETTRLATLPEIGPDFASKSATSRVVIPPGSNGNYQLHLTLKPASGDPPISGGGDPKKVDRIARVPELVIHGDNDNTVSVQRSREMVEAGKKAGAEIKYIEVPGGTHVGVAVPAFKDIFEWFDAHHRKTEAAKTAPGK